MGIRDTLDARGLNPQKKWGQNFLTDPRILESIVLAGDVTPQDTVLEIGPGLGHLTQVLAKHAGRVVAVEIDQGLAAKLDTDFATVPNVQIRHGDFLTRQPVEWVLGEQAGEPPSAPIRFKIIANLPYYITSAILRHILEAQVKPQTIVVMVQREVAQRMNARPPEMNLLAVSVQYFARVHVVRKIAAGAFYPRPSVESAVVRLDVLDPLPLAIQETSAFFDLVRAGFSAKRKRLRNSLSQGLQIEPHVAEALLVRSHIDATRRAETLTLPEWGRLYAEWRHQNGSSLGSLRVG